MDRPASTSPTVDGELLKAIGQVTINFSRLHAEVETFAWRLIGPNHRAGRIVTSGMTFGKLLELFEALFRTRKPDSGTRERFTTIIADLKAVNAERNKVFHSFWHPDGAGTATRSKLGHKRGLMTAWSKRTTAPEMADFAERIADVSWQFTQFMVRALDWESDQRDPTEMRRPI